MTAAPPLRTVPRFLAWQASRQPVTLAAGIAFGVVWMLSQAAWPYLLGRAIDDGLQTGGGRLWLWCALLLLTGVVQAVFGMLRHRMAVTNWLDSSLGVSRLIGHHSADTGRSITATTPSGEIVSTVNNDALRLGEMFDVTARLGGGVVAYVVVAVMVLTTSVELGLTVIVGVPLVAASLALLIRPLQGRQRAWRQESGRLATLGADTVVGLRVLRGIGGEPEFVERYRAQSQRVRATGIGVAITQSWLDGLQVVLPGVFLAAVVLEGAELAIAGRITAGELTTFAGYATFLVVPLRTGVEAAGAFVRGSIAARRVLEVLRIRPAVRDATDPREAPPSGADLLDTASGARIEPGRVTALVDADPDAAARIAVRLGRFDDEALRESPVLWGGVDSRAVPLSEVRRRIVVHDADPVLFEGRLVDGLDVRGDAESTATARLAKVDAALRAAAAVETVEALPDGLHEVVPERGRSFSGGQRQRLALARALLTDAEVLVLVEPTSAVDAHTEAVIADGLEHARRGRTTVVVTASPLLLGRTDHVVVLEHGTAVGSGTHDELLHLDDDLGALYRATVSRSTNRTEPRAGEHLEGPETGSIDALWTATHPIDLVDRDAVDDADDHADADADRHADHDAHGQGDADAAADR